MTSKLVVNTIEADTGISSVSFASSISMNSTAKFHFSNAGIDIGADTNINRPSAGVLGFNINGAEKLRIDTNGHLNTSGIVTAANFKSGVTNVHNLGVTLTGGQLDVGSNIQLGNAGVVTATSFVGSGAQLTGITGTTINNNADNRVITGSGTANTLNGESGVTIDGSNILSILGSGQQQLNVGSTNAGGAAIVLDGDSNGDGSGGDYSLIRHNTDGDLEFYARSTGGATNTIFKQGTTEKFRITSTGVHKISQSANLTDGSFYSTITISSPNGVYQGLRFDRGNVAKWRIGMKNDDTFQIANLFHNGSAGAEDNCVRITDNDDINITGNLKISTAGNGISFAADANGGMTNSEVLDDYEEGYYYPAAYGTSSTTSAYYYSGENKLGYVKIGKLVTIMGRLRLQADNYGGGLRMTLPYAAVQGSNTSNSAMSAVGTHGVNFDSDDMGLFIEIFPNTSYADFIVTQDNQGWINATNNYISANNYLAFHISYVTND